MTIAKKDIYEIFPKEEDCIKFLETIRWDGKPTCPICGLSNYSVASTPRIYHCNSCNYNFSVTAKTIFHRTRCDLQKWFLAIYLYARPAKTITAREMGDILDCTKDTAWLIMKKITAERVKSSDLFNKIIDTINSKRK